MRVKITDEMREAIQSRPGQPLEICDEETNTVYVLMTREQFRKWVYDDSDVTPEEMLAILAQALDDPETWGAPGMEAYDDYDSQRNPKA